MLSEREIEALERYRSREFHYADVECDRQALALAMLRLYPPGWNDPATPERLVELGFNKYKWIDTWGKWRQQVANCADVTTYSLKTGNMLWEIRVRLGDDRWWLVPSDGIEREIPAAISPRNMQEARQLLERCGAIKETT